jgi:hypothetical protein
MSNKRYLVSVVLFTGILVSFSAESFAQNFHFSVFGGWNKPGKVTVDNVRSGLDGNAMVGVRFEADFARVIGWENTFAYSPNFGRPEGLSTTDDDARALIYSSNLVLNVPLERIVPYATVGLGLLSSKRILRDPTELLTREFGTEFAINYGGGLKLTRLAGPVGLRFDVRGYTLPDVFSERLNVLEVSGGIIFTF